MLFIVEDKTSIQFPLQIGSGKLDMQPRQGHRKSLKKSKAAKAQKVFYKETCHNNKNI